MCNKLKNIISIIFSVLIGVGLVSFGFIIVAHIEFKGLVGALFWGDIIAGTLALVAAWLGTDSDSNTRPILILAIFFFVFTRIGHLSIL